MFSARIASFLAWTAASTEVGKLGLQVVMLSIGLLISLTYALVRPERF